VLGTADVARASPDGYTLLRGATYSITVEPLTDKQAGYSVKSFTPICQTFNDHMVVVPPNSPLKTATSSMQPNASPARSPSAFRASPSVASVFPRTIC
jgi:tripartite-type tricarboxylate transporter receptor subunit TctC